MAINPKICERNEPLIRLRKDRGLTAYQLAEKLGYTRTYICYVETGRSEGKRSFWHDIQTFYGIPDEKMWDLQNGKDIGI